MSETGSPINRLTEIDIEVKALTDEAFVRWGKGESLADIVKETAVRSVLDYLVSVDIKGAYSPDMPPEIRTAADEFNDKWQEQLIAMAPEERDALALHMLEGLVQDRAAGRIEE